ncbi:hypothetical protein TCE0_060r19415 [Talaromyces pinophilus]|uniref:Salicylate hydroxylase n=1 Tax=Talaromyces pinophilus TaxID=128442 RepID=A0A6V8HTV9_TALPI|nr:hypothetical protein TCE0_060r19415 [Talaromyces pinophilus]
MTSEKFRIAIIGSGPIGKLLACSAAPHPRIEFTQYEADVLPLRPSFGYGIGPQTFHAAHVLNPAVGKRLYEESFKDTIWMRWWHGGEEDELIANVDIIEGRVFGRLGREELMDLLDDMLPEGMSKDDIQYGKRLVDVRKTGPQQLELVFEDGSKDVANAVWAADGVNSFCRKLVQGESYRPPSYTGMLAYRGKVDAKRVAELVGESFSKETYMFIGVKGWHMLIFPIDHGKYVNIAAFCVEPEEKRFKRDEKVTLEQLLSYYPKRNSKVDALLKLVHSDTRGGCQRLNITHMEKLETLFNSELGITLFGDAANAMTPHIAGSMSCGFIGCATFLHEEWNQRIRSGLLPADASNAEIADALVDASRAYEIKHLPLAQKLVDISAEQGPMWSGGITDVPLLKERPLFLWTSADEKH